MVAGRCQRSLWELKFVGPPLSEENKLLGSQNSVGKVYDNSIFSRKWVTNLISQYIEFILRLWVWECQDQVPISIIHQKNLRPSTFTTPKDIKIRQPGPELRGCQNVTQLLDTLYKVSTLN